MSAAKVHEPDMMGFGYDDGWIAYPRSLVPTRSEARKRYMDFTGIADFIGVRVLARWAVHTPQEHDSEWWTFCEKDTPGAFPIWKCE